MWPDLYFHHFKQHLGLPFDVETYKGENGAELRLATFDERFPNYRTYASIGLSNYAEKLGGRGEIILLADDLGKDIPQLFVNMLFFILDNGISLKERFAVSGIESLNSSFAEEFDKAAIYVTLADGIDPDFEHIQFRDEVGVVYQGIFISWPEYDYLNRHGPKEFEVKLRSSDADLCSLNRPSCIGGID